MAPAAYCIQLPPPNVTGTLHMGHAFQQTLMDALIRYHRMRGFNTNWVVGHRPRGHRHADRGRAPARGRGQDAPRPGPREVRRARVAVEAAVGLDHHAPDAPPGRLGELDYADTKDRSRLLHHGRDDVARRGRSVRAPARGRPDLSRQAPGELGPGAGTAVSDLEVDTEEEDGRIWEIRYPLEDGSGSLVVATTRPETMLGDVAVAVHPEDERYRQLVGKTVKLPLTGRRSRSSPTIRRPATSAPAASRSRPRTISTISTSGGVCLLRIDPSPRCHMLAS